MRIREFEWDHGNTTHLRLSHGVEPEEAEEVFLDKPLIRRTKKGHYAAFGHTFDGRYLIIIFEQKARGVIRPITAWDMSDSERRYYRKSIGE